MRKLMLVALMIGLVAGSASAAILPLVNGSFETGVPAGWSQGDFTGWLNAGGGHVICIDGGSSGAKFLLLDMPSAGGTAQVLQHTSYVIQDGYTYTVSFDVRHQPTVAAGTNLMGILAIDSEGAATQVGGGAFYNTLDDAWHTHSAGFTATAAEAGQTLSLYVAFQQGAGNSPYAYLDNVTLEAVPEPATMAILLTGMAGVALRKRRNA